MPVGRRVEKAVRTTTLRARPICGTGTDEGGTAAHTNQTRGRIEIRYKTSLNGRKKAQQNHGKRLENSCQPTDYVNSREVYTV